MGEDNPGQLSTRDVLLVTTCAGIAAGGATAAWRIAETQGVSTLSAFGSVLYVSPWWIPLTFIGYVLGRRKLPAQAAVMFAAMEAMSIGAMQWAAML